MAKAIRIHQQGEPEVMRFEDVEVPAPGRGEVRLRVRAIGLNRSEAMFRKGAYPVRPKLPTQIGYEGVGIVQALGAGVEGFSVGDRVCVVPNYQLGEYGMYAEETIVPARSLLHAPPGLSDVDAAAIWMQYLTAMAIIEIGKATVGDYVLVPAASSSVGLAAMQLANWAGAVPIAATRRSDKAAALKAQGVQHIIATEETDLVAEVMRITQGKGARLVFDPVGGPYVETLARAMADEGILFIYGSLSGHAHDTVFPHWPACMKGLSIRGWVASAIWNKPDRYARAQSLILRGLAEGHLKPVIARTFPLAQIVDAHRYLESNQQLGKIVVTVNS